MPLTEVGQPQHSALRHLTFEHSLVCHSQVAGFLIDSSHIFYWIVIPHSMGFESHTARKQRHAAAFLSSVAALVA